MSPDREMERASADAIDQWYKRATSACAPFLFPESRYRNPWTDDELPGALAAARRWHEQNPCPDPSLDEHLSAILDAYAEMAVATVARVMEIREDIALHAKALDRRKLPRPEPPVTPA
jgi:hypothetical protein